MGQHRTNKTKRKQLKKQARRAAKAEREWAEFCRENGIPDYGDTKPPTVDEG